MSDLNDVINQNDCEGYMLCAYSLEKRENLYVMDNRSFPLNSKLNILKMRVTGINGYSKKKETIKALEWVDRIKPDIIHLHNIHGDWINLKLLFYYIKEKKIAVVWTLHDCWAFTGRCSHFELCGCYKWKTECNNCPNRKVYPKTYFFDFSKRMYIDKKDMFTGMDNVYIVTPSKWLKQYVISSYLGEYPVCVINNGIDTSVFKNSKNTSKYLKNEGKIIVLGVASSWSDTKGFSDFIKLDEMLDHNKFQIVMVGLNEKQLCSIPNTIIGIERTNNVEELVELYSNADVFVNLTYQDNYPTTNLEAVSCGIPVITYRTGGSPESISNTNGYIVKQGDLKQVAELIRNVSWSEIDPAELHERVADIFSKEKCFKKYLDLYANIDQ